MVFIFICVFSYFQFLINPLDEELITKEHIDICEKYGEMDKIVELKSFKDVVKHGLDEIFLTFQVNFRDTFEEWLDENCPSQNQIISENKVLKIIVLI